MKSIVLVRLSAMGDVVQSLGAVASLYAEHPDWRVTFVTQREWVPLLEGVDGIDRVVSFDRRGGVRALWALRAELRRERCDVALDLQGNWKSAVVTRCAGARQHVGMASAWRQEPWSRLLLGRTVSCEATPHPARAAWELVKQVAPESPFLRGELVATAAEIAAEQSALTELGVEWKAPFSVVVVTATSDVRALRPSMVEVLARSSTPVVMLLGPDEISMPSPDGAVIRHGRGEVRRLVALGALVAQAGGEVIGPDQGATHVLLAAGASGRVFFGSQDPRRTAPPSAQPYVRAGELACRPCRSRICHNPQGVQCMEIEPGQAVAAESALPPLGAIGSGPWPDLV